MNQSADDFGSRLAFEEHLYALCEFRGPLADGQDLLRQLARVVTDDFNNEFTDIFDPGGAPDTRRLMAAAALWLVASQSDLLDDVDLRVRVLRLLDATLEEAVYAGRARTGSQTHEKSQALASVMTDFDRLITAAVDHLDAIDDFPRVRELYLKEFNSRIAKHCLHPLLSPAAVTEVSLALAAVQEYIDSDMSDVAKAFATATHHVSLLSASTDTAPHLWSYRLVGRFANKLKELVSQDIASNPMALPGNLTVEGSNKRYPLDQIGATFDAVLLVRNEGSGPAHETYVSIDDFVGGVAVPSPSIFLGRLEPQSETEVDVPIAVELDESLAILTGRVEWIDFGGSPSSRQFEVTLVAQRTGIDWGTVVHTQPYSLEPVTSEDELVGRGQLLNQLTAKASAKSVGSFIITGQKRVGKTSVARTLAERLEKSGFVVVYLEAGDYVLPDAGRTIASLGTRICEELTRADSRLEQLPIPNFVDALAPAGDFLRNAQRLIPELKVFFMLDEFDELPVAAYGRGDVGDALFLTIRALSAKTPFGFALIGGEKMPLILNSQGDALNKFSVQKVDYFDLERDRGDFADLVRQPVRGILDIDDDALLSLHQYTAGNPFFAKLVCGRMFDLMVDQRDTHVTSREMEDAFHSVLEGDYVSSNTFQHFWEDGILDVPERVEEHSLNRRRLLLGFAAMMRDRSPATREALLGAARRQGLGPADAEGVLRDLERRDIVELSGNVFLPTVPFFAAWLEDEGLHAIVNTLMDPDAAERLRSEEERAYIHPTEIVGLVASWGHYRGRALTEDRIRAWLDQFGDQHQRRLVFSLLEGIDFFSRSRIGAHLSEAHEVVRRRIKYSIDTKRRKQGEFLISYLGGPGKSGATYARLYANENKIYKDNVVEPNRVVRRLQGDGEVQAVVYVDDFLGTGDTLLDSLPEIKSELGERLEKGDLSLYFIFVSGFERARDRLNRAATEVGMPFQVFMAEPLADIARAFDPGNTLFDSEADREEARRLAQRFGERLEKKIPLGYGDDQALVVFEDSIPNNSLPILWSQSRDFEPLFPRV